MLGFTANILFLANFKLSSFISGSISCFLGFFCGVIVFSTPWYPLSPWNFCSLSKFFVVLWVNYMAFWTSFSDNHIYYFCTFFCHYYLVFQCMVFLFFQGNIFSVYHQRMAYICFVLYYLQWFFRILKLTCSSLVISFINRTYVKVVLLV